MLEASDLADWGCTTIRKTDAVMQFLREASDEERTAWAERVLKGEE